jgi:16S rRNA (cytidine1402-2'-O)-methyltransferase
MPGTLFVVATPIGNLEDITLRALRVLREVSVIAAEDTRRTAHLLSRHAIATRTTSLHEHNESKKTAAIVDRLLKGEDVALVSDAGTPTISDPGGHLIQDAVAAGVPVVPIPGPSAVMTALAASGLPTATFTFLGFPPIRSTDRTQWFETLANAPGTVVFFEAPHRIHATLDELRRTIGDRHIVVGRELTKIHEEFIRGPVSTVNTVALGERGEFTVVVNIGQLTNNIVAVAPSPSELAQQFGELTATIGVTRRQAIAQLAKRYHLAANDVYNAIEISKKSVE